MSGRIYKRFGTSERRDGGDWCRHLHQFCAIHCLEQSKLLVLLRSVQPVEQVRDLMINRKVVLVARPDGQPEESDFKIVEEAVPELTDDQVLVEVEHLSIDAFIRTTLDGEAGIHGTMDLDTPVIALGVASGRLD